MKYKKKFFMKLFFTHNSNVKLFFLRNYSHPSEKFLTPRFGKKYFAAPKIIIPLSGGSGLFWEEKQLIPLRNRKKRNEPAAKLGKTGYGCRKTVWKIMWKKYRLAGREAKFQALGTRYIACGRLFASTRTGFGLHASARSPSRSAEQAQTQSVS